MNPPAAAFPPKVRFADKVSVGLDLARAFVASSARARRYRDQLDSVQTYCMFIGYPRSGHSLIGSLLDAHRHMVIALEEDALRYVRFGFNRDRIFTLLLENSVAAMASGREWTGYSYQVPGQWQGKYEVIQVIGDKKGGESSKHLAKDITLLSKLQNVVGPAVTIKLLHVVRNPFDTISTMSTRGNASSLDEAIDLFFKMAETVVRVHRYAGDYDMLTLRHEAVIQTPQQELARVCRFLGVDSPDDYLADCASIVFDSPHKTRHKAPWDETRRATVQRRLDEFDFLKGYTFDE